MLTLLVPILIRFLLEGSQQRTSTKFCIQLHEQSLQWLMKIGPKYPQVRCIIKFCNFQLLKFSISNRNSKLSWLKRRNCGWSLSRRREINSKRWPFKRQRWKPKTRIERQCKHNSRRSNWRQSLSSRKILEISCRTSLL